MTLRRPEKKKKTKQRPTWPPSMMKLKEKRQREVSIPKLTKILPNFPNKLIKLRALNQELSQNQLLLRKPKSQKLMPILDYQNYQRNLRKNKKNKIRLKVIKMMKRK